MSILLPNELELPDLSELPSLEDVAAGRVTFCFAERHGLRRRWRWLEPFIAKAFPGWGKPVSASWANETDHPIRVGGYLTIIDTPEHSGWHWKHDEITLQPGRSASVRPSFSVAIGGGNGDRLPKGLIIP